MNAVEIEEAVSRLAEAPFDPEEFPFAFLEAFGNKLTTIKRLQSKSGSSNQSDLSGGVLQRNNIHLKVCPEGEVTNTLSALRESKATARHKAKFILATDGKSFEAENVVDGETIACEYPDFHDHFGFFLPLAGITTVRQIRENAFDIKATGRLNRLYIELLKDNPDWDKADRREALNHFMARLIFCFFAEDTNIFHSDGLFTATVQKMSAIDSSNTHEVLSELFRAMCTPPNPKAREAAKIRNWADVFPYVNGGLFSGGVEVPRFSKIARSYLLHVGNLDWTKINPDIFGSMIQAVADDEERGALGMHYTSVPNILKVLNPLFLDDLRSQLEAAGDNARKLLNLRQRMARIRVFDPACGSGNFLVIAYKEMRGIEAEINRRRGEPDRKSEIPLTNFRGIELRHFSCEIARLALIIAEYQCDVMYRGPKLALAEFLPLKDDNWVTCGNALRLDWLSICPTTGTGVKVQREDLDLFGEMGEVAEIDFENEGGETYICGNPPYLGGKSQTKEQKEELLNTFGSKNKIGELDYVTGWLRKGAEYLIQNDARVAFVVTNSVNQGAQVHQLWPQIFELGVEIFFAHRDFKWANNASRNAAVICSIIGIKLRNSEIKNLFGDNVAQKVSCIGPYLIPGNETIVKQALEPVSELMPIITGNSPYDGGNLMLSGQERLDMLQRFPEANHLIRNVYGARDYINGEQRYCLWIDDENIDIANSIPDIKQRIQKVLEFRCEGGEVAKGLTNFPHRFRYTHQAKKHLIIAPRVSSERRYYIPFGLLSKNCIVSDSAQAIYDAELWHLAILLSLIHMSWVRVVAGKLKTDLRYSSALCYNTFPVPTLTDRNKADLTHCAEEILLAREQYFPATIADMYDRDRMDTEFPLVREAHDRNDEILERIYIGRRFKNDTERLEKLFELYTKMTSQQAPSKKSAKGKI
ncbi:class I SAM-dependent DNA methyltransferase [Microcoleus sp. herbarium12]|uniref:class I SAM-dependent DNA methyltransferase n=1 Tax=Microcoleus sp. herbarium12 TaxID=3055437 RepID=UPI002FD78859